MIGVNFLLIITPKNFIQGESNKRFQAAQDLEENVKNSNVSIPT